MRVIKLMIPVFILGFGLLAAKPAAKPDSLKIYSLGQVTVTEEFEVKTVLESPLKTNNYYVIQNSDVISVADFELYIPSGRIRTNSRGESMLFLRGAGERQLGLFFDGVPMNVPWDNRMDLSFVPPDIIGSFEVNKNASSILFGPNVLGGAVDISTVERQTRGFGFRFKAQAGDASNKYFSALNDGRIGKFNYIANVSWLDNPGFIMSDDAPEGIENQYGYSSIRTNSFNERLALYARGEYQFGATTAGISVSHIDQEKGVPPETNEGEDARFWIYPDRSRTIIALNTDHDLNEMSYIKATIWYDMYKQKIEDYNSLDYDEINEIQKDEDNTAGIRLSYENQLNDNHKFGIVFNGYSTTHNEQTLGSSVKEYSQNTLSFGPEYAGFFGKLELGAGLNYDYNETPLTGDFSEAEGSSTSDCAAFILAKYYFSNKFYAFANSSRRTRFPTMREQYSGALGKFLVNPDLKPETGILNEFGFAFGREGYTIEIALFANLYDNLIGQIRLDDGLRQRENYSSATIYGLDLGYAYTRGKFDLEGNLTFLQTEAEQNGEEVEHLDNRPELMLSAIAKYSFNFGMQPQIELNYTGTQFERISGKFEEIGQSLVMNLRVGYRLPPIMDTLTEVYIRVNNITDEYRLSQFGLPEPGRMAFAGIMFSM
ncbi:MAG: TonB-dependent receptor plug domain-containing protein [Candidatus Kapaibacterium sp.]